MKSVRSSKDDKDGLLDNSYFNFVLERKGSGLAAGAFLSHAEAFLSHAEAQTISRRVFSGFVEPLDVVIVSALVSVAN
jgi:hypothetical protein